MSFDIFLLEFQCRLTVRATAKTFGYLNAVTRWQNAAHFFLRSDSYSVFFHDTLEATTCTLVL